MLTNCPVSSHTDHSQAFDIKQKSVWHLHKTLKALKKKKKKTQNRKIPYFGKLSQRPWSFSMILLRLAVSTFLFQRTFSSLLRQPGLTVYFPSFTFKQTNTFPRKEDQLGSVGEISLANKTRPGITYETKSVQVAVKKQSYLCALMDGVRTYSPIHLNVQRWELGPQPMNLDIHKEINDS